MTTQRGDQAISAIEPVLRPCTYSSSVGSQSAITPVDTLTTGLEDLDYDEFCSASIRSNRIEDARNKQQPPHHAQTVTSSSSRAMIEAQPPNPLALPRGESCLSIDPQSTLKSFDADLNYNRQVQVSELVARSAERLASSEVSSLTAKELQRLAAIQHAPHLASPRAQTYDWNPLPSTQASLDSNLPVDGPHTDIKSQETGNSRKRRKRKPHHAIVHQADRCEDNGFDGTQLSSLQRGLEDGGQTVDLGNSTAAPLAKRRRRSPPPYHAEALGRNVAEAAFGAPHEALSTIARNPPLVGKRLAARVSQKTLPHRFAEASTSGNALTGPHAQHRARPAIFSSPQPSRRQYICNICGGIFKKKSNLDDHRRTHSDVREAICDCGKAFKDNSTLHRHEKTHLSEHEHICYGCSKTFSQKNQLKVHVRGRKQKNECVKVWNESGDHLDLLNHLLTS